MDEPPGLGRILRSADFVRVLASPACARSPHFAVHFTAGCPSQAAKRRGNGVAKPEPGPIELSTGNGLNCQEPVDNFIESSRVDAVPSPFVWWLGAVVPKRHAKRAVTRTLLKRQIRAALARHALAAGTPSRHGLWVVRLRASFDRAAYPSAASSALRDAATGELDMMLAQAGRKLGAGAGDR